MQSFLRFKKNKEFQLKVEEDYANNQAGFMEAYTHEIGSIVLDEWIEELEEYTYDAFPEYKIIMREKILGNTTKYFLVNLKTSGYFDSETRLIWGIIHSYAVF
jgi:hypothetical protein